uniref:ethanolamine kinase n=1 Tax=Latimeria chalumnae TaxID=7897 RepID=H3ADH0_LATCH
FTDGITNKLVGCYVDPAMDDVVLVRVYGNKTELFVDRDNELRSFQVLHANGCAPNLYCTFQNGLCYEFMKGTALGPEHVRDPTLFRLIARELAKIHAIHAHNGCIPKPNLWLKLRKYFSLVAAEFRAEPVGSRFHQEVPRLEILEQEITWLKEYLSQLNSPVVLCHNDLLCKNIIYNEKEGSVKFIDYEYASYSYQAFDIGNHFNEFAGFLLWVRQADKANAHRRGNTLCLGVSEVDYNLYPSRELQLEWLRFYLQVYKEFTKKRGAVTEEEIETLYIQVNQFALKEAVLQTSCNCTMYCLKTYTYIMISLVSSQASHFFWGFWALIQAKFSTIDFDFLRYAVLRFSQYFKMKPEVMALEFPK